MCLQMPKPIFVRENACIVVEGEEEEFIAQPQLINQQKSAEAITPAIRAEYEQSMLREKELSEEQKEHLLILLNLGYKDFLINYLCY